MTASGYQASPLLLGAYKLGIETVAPYGTIQLTLFSNITSDPISPMKLEFGEGQTFAHQEANGNWVLNDPTPNLALERLKCQEHYRIVGRD